MAGSGEDPKRPPAVPTFAVPPAPPPTAPPPAHPPRTVLPPRTGRLAHNPVESQPGTATAQPPSGTIPLPPPSIPPEALAGTRPPPVSPADVAATTPWSPAHMSAETLVGPPSPGLLAAVAARPGAIGPFDVIRELARGGMGVIYVARRAGLDRLVALKQMRSDDGPPHPAHVQRFLDEARLAARLQHPNIVRVLEVGEQDGLPWFAMDLIDGENLEARVRRSGPLPGREAARLFEKLARALAYAHGQRLLHRDLKPGNVLISNAGGEPAITDFGLVRALDEDGKVRMTQEGDLMGTPAYMPPEQAEGALDRIDQRADVYSLGATLYEAITGKLPFEGKTTVAVLHAVMTQDPIPPSKFVPSVHRDLETIVLRCLEKDPLRRYPGAAALAEDLGRFARDEPIEARRPTRGERLGRWVRRNRALAATGAALLACLFVGGPLTALWVLRTRAAEGARERQRLAGRAADEARQALSGIALPTSDAPRERRQAELDEALGKALRASRAAEQWRLLTPEDPQAGATAIAAATRLADVAAEGEQWAVARQSLDLAREAGLDPAAHGRAVEDLQARRDQNLTRRKGEVGAILGEVERGQPAGAVLRLLRYGEPELVQHMCERLDALSAELTEAEVALYEGARRGLEEERGREAEELPELGPIVRRRAGGAAPGPVEADALRQAEERFLFRAGRGARDAVAVVARVQAERLGPGRLEVAGVLCECLGALKDPRAAPALRRYLMAEAAEARAARAGRGLLLLGTDDAPAALAAAGSRFPPGGPLAALREGRDPTADDADRRLVRSLDPFQEHPDPASVEAALDRLLRGREDDLGLLARRSWLRTARDELALGQADAEQACQRIESQPDTTVGQARAEEQGWAALFLARTFTGLGDEARARRYADLGVALIPHAAEGYLVRGDLLKESRPMEALGDLERAIERAPHDLEAQGLRALLFTFGGNHSEAVKESQRLVNAAPELSIAWTAQAMALSNQGLESQALEASDRALALDARSLNAHYVRMFVRNAIDPAGALAAGETILARRPGSYPTLITTARLLERLGRFGEALARCQAILAISPEEPIVHVLVARIHRRSGRLAEARGEWRALTSVDYPLALVERVHLLRDEGDRTSARRELIRGSVRLNGRVDGFEEESLEEWAEQLLDLAPLEPALLASVEEALALRPEAPLVLLLRGATRLAAGKPSEARSDVERALTLRKDVPHGRRVLAALLREAGDHAAALRELAAGLEKYPADPHLLLARAGERLLSGDRPGAIEAFSARAGKDAAAAAFAALLARQPGLLEPHLADPGSDGFVARAALGRAQVGELLAAAETAEGAAGKAWRRCQARALLGLRAEEAGDAAAARTHYQAAAQESVPCFERAWARRRLAK